MVFGYFRQMEDAINAFFGRFQFLFNFATEKFVVIKDWRLGLVLRLLQIGILIYVLYDVINQASYLIQEVPKGTVTPSTDVTGRGRIRSLNTQRDLYNGNTELPYCRSNGPSFDYTYNNETYDNFQCIVMDPLSIPETGEAEFFITTYLRLDKVYYVDKAQGVTCPSAETGIIEEIPTTATFLGDYYNVCLYSGVEQYFPIQPEGVPLEMLHSYYTSVVGANDALPETFIRPVNYDGGELHFNEGQPIRLELSTLLKLAGVDLDQRLNNQTNENTPPDTAKDEGADAYPFARLSGLTLIMRFKYYHRALGPSSIKVSAGPKRDNVICIVEVEPQFIWTSKTSDVHYQISDASHPFIINPSRQPTLGGEGSNLTYEAVQVDFQRNGVKMIFQVSGNMGKFDFFSLVNALVAGAVLMSVAQVVVTYIALYALGLSSQLYMEYMRESVNWRKEYARFATQSLVAGNTFTGFDKNDSGTLDRREIYQYLSDTFKDVLDPPKLACLTDFLMRHGEMDADVSKGRLDTIADVKISTINMAEWVDIFTEEKVKINSLNRLVNSEYDDPKIVQVLLDLAEGRLGRGLTHLESGEVLALTSADLEASRIESPDPTPGDRLLKAGESSTPPKEEEGDPTKKPPGNEES